MKNQVIKIIFSGLIVCTMVFGIVGNALAEGEGPPTPIVCTSWVYSEWSTCQTDGTQTRTIISSSPEGCIVEEPVLEQSCTPTPGCADGYFCDTETSTENEMVAGTLDFSLTSPSDFLPSPVLKGGTTTRNITVANDGNLNFKYDAGAIQTGGNPSLCNILNLRVTKGPDTLYNNNLTSFDQFDSEITNSGTPDNLSFEVTLPSGVDDSLQGEICQFRLDFDAWQTDLSYGQGFEDEEELDNQISAGYWNPSVVLNEFLPNAGDYPEFIELYNQTGSAIDLKYFYIKADSNEILINSTTTATYSGGNTTISAHGWLVVTTGGDLMNNTSGTITLYNPNDVVVDTYTYDAADNNINNNPGWTNNLVAYWPLDGNANDLSGNSNNGTVNGPIFVGGKINQGLSFDGIDDYIEVAHSSSLNIGGDKITLEAWINPTSLSVSGVSVINKPSAYSLMITAGGKVRVYLGPSDYVETDNIEVFIGSWTHISAVYDGSNITIYVNGVLRKQTAKTGNQATSINNLMIGAKKLTSYFDGSIDEVKIYSRALDSAEILNHYNAVDAGGTVPTDKSYARIPDGSSNWVDPIPTPGAPNIVQEIVVQIIPEPEDILPEQTIESSQSTDPILEPLIEDQQSAEENIAETIIVIEENVEIIEELMGDTNESQEEIIIDQTDELQDPEPLIEEIVPEQITDIQNVETIIENSENLTDQQDTVEQTTVVETIDETIPQ